MGRLGVWVHNDECCGVQQKLIDNLSKPLSKSTTDHISNRHDYNLVKKQIEAIVNKTGKTKEEAIKMLNIGDRTFFNKNWSNETIIKATEYARQDAIKNNVLSGNHSVLYRGEKITINISNEGKVSTAYGNHKYDLKDF